MLKKIYQEMVAIRKELQAIRNRSEFEVSTMIDYQEVGRVVQQANRDND